jgi:hypothetical protein
MSLVALALRIATVKALAGRTFAEGRVFDSAIAPLDVTVSEERAPLIVVYTDEESAEVSGHDLLVPDRALSLVIHCAVASKVTAAAGGVTVESGSLVVTIEASTISAGPHADWQVTASAGSVSAALSLFSDTRAARDAAGQIKADTQAIRAAVVAETTAIQVATVAARDTAVQAASQANAAALLIAGGPVGSVNGRTGNVVLGQTDIPGLPDAIAQQAKIIQGLRAAANISGGGTISCIADGPLWRLKWSQRFMVVGDAKGTASVGGTTYTEINCPLSGNIDLVGAVPVAANANGIGFADWGALYYDLSAGSGAGAAAFHVVQYNAGSANFLPPPEWVLLAVLNRDGQYVQLANGQRVPFGFAIDTTSNKTGVSGVFSGSLSIGNDYAGLSGIFKSFSAGHSATNVPSQLMLAMSDATFSGVAIKSVRDGNYNSQSIEFLTHHGGVSEGTRMTIDKDGRVGIGTSTPSATLDVVGSAIFRNQANQLFLADTNGPANQNIVKFNHDNGNFLMQLVSDDYSLNGAFLIVTRVGAAPQAIIFPAGNVGVGTGTPAYPVDVNGTVRCSGEFISAETGICAFRAVAGNYGAMFRNDGTFFYLLITGAGDQYGSWNTLRPFYVNLATGVVSLSDTVPHGDNTRTLGSASARWSAIWAANGAVQTSDVRSKVDIGPDDLGLPFICGLEVISYRERDDPPGERRRGLVAQQVLELLGDRPTTAIVTHDEALDRYGINYAGLVPALISAVQTLEKRVAALERRSAA